MSLEDQAVGGFDSDQDEWDLLKDQTLLQTIVNDTNLQIQEGDRCRVISGSF